MGARLRDWLGVDVDLGGSATAQGMVDCFAHATGLLLLLDTGRNRVFGASGPELMEAYVDDRVARISPEEVAFYDALADNQSAVEVLGNDQLKVIAHELLKGLRANVTVDWAHRDSARARLRVLVKRILRRFGYPPDLEDAAVRGVLAQAEAMLAETVTI